MGKHGSSENSNSSSNHKRKRSYPTRYEEEEKSNFSSDALFKRPRGRPPLLVNMPTTRNDKLPAIPKTPTGKSSIPKSSMISVAARTPKHVQVKDLSVAAFQHHVFKDKYPDNTGIDNSKTKERQPSSVTTQHVLRRLMTDAPLRVVDLAKLIPDAQKDAVQSVIDILQVLGIVVPLKLIPQSKSQKSSSSGGASYLLNTYYTLTDFVKVPEAVDISSIEKDIKNKRENIALTRERTNILNEISLQEIPSSEKQSILRKEIKTFMEKDPSLSEDILYQSIYLQV